MTQSEIISFSLVFIQGSELMLTFLKSGFKIYQSSTLYYVAQIQATVTFFQEQ